MNTSESSNASLLMRPLQNHYARILLDPSSYSDAERRLFAPQIAVKYSPYLKFGLNGETVRYVKDNTNNIESSLSVVSPANFQSNRAGSSDDIIFYYELEILKMNDNSEMCFGLGLPRFPVHKQPGFSKKARCSYGCNRLGEIKCSKIRAHSKLPSWKVGDIVGCGYNYLTNEIFFTKDQKQVIAFMGPSTSSRGSLVGKFKNEFKGYLPELEDDMSVYKLVQEYLQVNGYFNTLDEFTKNGMFLEENDKKKIENKEKEKEEEEEEQNRDQIEDVNIEVENNFEDNFQEINGEEEVEELQQQNYKERIQDPMQADVLQSVKVKNISDEICLKNHINEIRRAARMHLREGQEGVLVDLLEKEFPKQCLNFSAIITKIRMRQFIRLCVNGSLNERIAFAQRYLHKQNDQKIKQNDSNENDNYLDVSIVVFDKKLNKEIKLTKEDVLGVFCYESISASPLKGILDPYAEERLWEDINQVILAQGGYSNESRLELACKQMIVIQQTMKQADMVEGTILNLV